MTTQEILSNATEKMEKAIAALKKEYANVRTGRANPLILEKIQVEYYGAPTPLKQLSNVTVQDGLTLVITPFDKTIIREIEKSIAKSDIGITPNNDGVCIRLTFPPLTEDRRKEICKSVKKMRQMLHLPYCGGYTEKSRGAPSLPSRLPLRVYTRCGRAGGEGRGRPCRH